MIRNRNRKLPDICKCLTGLALFFPLPAHATPVDTEWGRILSIDTGWTQPYMHMEMSFPVVNPDGCPWSGLYTIPPDITGYQTFQSLAMSAYFAGKQVAFTIDGCTGNRPKIISVKVRG